MPYSLKVKKREINGKKVKHLKDNFLIPGVVYGPERKENLLIEVQDQSLNKLYKQAGESSLIDLTVQGNDKPIEVVIKDIQFDPVTDKLIHVDFYQIKRGQKIDAETDLNFIGEAPVVKESGGIIIKNIDSIAIRCLPRDLEKVASIEVDISKLKGFDDSIYVKDLDLPEEIEILEDLDTVIVSAQEPAEEEEELPPAPETLEEEMEKVELSEEKGVEEIEGEEKKEAPEAEAKPEAESKE